VSNNIESRPNKKIRVMIVDDQAIVIDILTRSLSLDPDLFIAGSATDGQLALNQLHRVKPDVIILDLEMPRMNGIQFLSQLMPVNPIPTIVLSALTFQNSKLTQEAFELGAVDFVSKPSGGAMALNNLINQLRTKIKIAAQQDARQLKKPVSQTLTLPNNALDRQTTLNQSILGMGAFEVSNEKGKTLKIFALGSCVGVALFSPANNIAALAHVVLPSSSNDRDKALSLPGYFADSAVAAMLNQMQNMGCNKTQIIAKLAGGAKTQAEVGDFFSIGSRNAVAAKAALLKNGIKVVSDDLGGAISRTASVVVGDTKLSLHHPEKGKWEI
jgi:chemotaxis receptor (MCP) glutamine deamidase CheD/ActR/RegA family two-component response regulator